MATRLQPLLALTLLVALGFPGTANAAEPLSRPTTARHALYLDLLGKGGLWGLGYDYRFRDWLAVGSTISLTFSDEQVLSLSPYLAAYPISGARHGWFVHAGPQLVHTRIPSPFPEWSGSSSTRVGGQLSTGYELRAELLFRAYGMVAFGTGGIAPWMGFSLGWAFK